MEVSFGTGETSSEVVPVTFETVVTETGVLQLWCVARDGAPLEAGVQCAGERGRMKVGIDLGTTNSALAYIDEREAEDRDFPPSTFSKRRNWWPPAGWRRAAPCPRSCFWKRASR